MANILLIFLITTRILFKLYFIKQLLNEVEQDLRNY